MNQSNCLHPGTHENLLEELYPWNSTGKQAGEQHGKRWKKQEKANSGYQDYHADILGKIAAWRWFTKAPPTRQADVQHSYWTLQHPARSFPLPAGMIISFIDPLKHNHFFSSCAIWLFFFLNTVSRNTDLLKCRWAMEGWGLVYGCLCSSVYALGKGVVGWLWQERTSGKHSETHGKDQALDIPRSAQVPVPRAISFSLLAPYHPCWHLPTERALLLFWAKPNQSMKSPAGGRCCTHTFISQSLVFLRWENTVAIGMVKDALFNSPNQLAIIIVILPGQLLPITT